MSLRPANLLVVVGALTLACMAGLAIVLLPLLPFQHQWARQRWEQHRPRHYEMEAWWTRDQQSGRVLVEVLDNQMVGGTNLDTGRPLKPDELLDMSRFVSIDSLLYVVETRVRPSPSWRHQLGRYHPLLARWLAPCAAPIPEVRYDAEFGYPTSISYHGGLCVATLVVGENAKVQIRGFRPLP